jgi:hypothetical protein
MGIHYYCELCLCVEQIPVLCNDTTTMISAWGGTSYTIPAVLQERESVCVFVIVIVKRPLVSS